MSSWCHSTIISAYQWAGWNSRVTLICQMGLLWKFGFYRTSHLPLFVQTFVFTDVHHSGRNYPTGRSFSPRFDIRESDDSYHLDGELPGLTQKDIDIEFSGSQTLMVTGRSEREYYTSDPGRTEAQGDENERIDKKSESTTGPGPANARSENCSAPSPFPLVSTGKRSRPAWRTAFHQEDHNWVVVRNWCLHITH
jgi:hypothetical protein